jgi:hypothetical protein
MAVAMEKRVVVPVKWVVGVLKRFLRHMPLIIPWRRQLKATQTQ